MHRFCVRRRRQLTPTVTKGLDHLQRPRTNSGLRLITHVSLVLIDECAGGTYLSVEQTGVTAHVDHTHHKRRYAGLLKGLLDHHIVIRDIKVSVWHSERSRCFEYRR